LTTLTISIHGAPVGFIALGMAKALFGYLLFGGLGGLLAP